MLTKRFKTFTPRSIIKVFQLLLLLSPLFKWIFIVPWNWEEYDSRRSIYDMHSKSNIFLWKPLKCLSSFSSVWSEAFFWKLNVRRQGTSNGALFASYLKFYWSQVIPLSISQKGNAKLKAGIFIASWRSSPVNIHFIL